MKPGDIIEAFGDPIKSKWPLGQVKLIKFIKESPTLELWQTETVKEPKEYHETFIKKAKDNLPKI